MRACSVYECLISEAYCRLLEEHAGISVIGPSLSRENLADMRRMIHEMEECELASYGEAIQYRQDFMHLCVAVKDPSLVMG